MCEFVLCNVLTFRRRHSRAEDARFQNIPRQKISETVWILKDMDPSPNLLTRKQIEQVQLLRPQHVVYPFQSWKIWKKRKKEKSEDGMPPSSPAYRCIQYTLYLNTSKHIHIQRTPNIEMVSVQFSSVTPVTCRMLGTSTDSKASTGAGGWTSQWWH